MRKNIIFWLMCTFVLLNCIFISVANAEMKTYEGVGESIMSERENANIAKEGAKLLAIKNAQDKAGVFISSNTQVKNNKLVKDDIVALTAEVVNLGEVKYEVIPLNITETLVTSYYRATLSVTIDTTTLENKISQYLNKNSLDRATIIAQNNELVKAVDDVKAKNEEVKNLIATAKTPQDNAKIKEELKSLDRATLYAQKVSEGNNYFKSGNSEMAQKLYREAIELYPNDATIAYEKLGDTYRLANNYNMAIEAYTKVIQMDPNYNVPYYKRGVAYYFLCDYQASKKDLEFSSYVTSVTPEILLRIYFILKDYDSALNLSQKRGDVFAKVFKDLKNLTNSIKLNPNDYMLYFNRGKTYFKLEYVFHPTNDRTNEISLPFYNQIIYQVAIPDFDKFMQNMDEKFLNKKDRKDIYLELAKYYERCGAYDKAVKARGKV